MSTESCATIDFEALKKALVAGIAKARSLDEIEHGWPQHGVKSVQLADYLLKSNPPQRDFILELRKENASTVTKIVNVFDLGNKNFSFTNCVISKNPREHQPPFLSGAIRSDHELT